MKYVVETEHRVINDRYDNLDNAIAHAKDEQARIDADPDGGVIRETVRVVAVERSGAHKSSQILWPKVGECYASQ